MHKICAKYAPYVQGAKQVQNRSETGSVQSTQHLNTHMKIQKSISYSVFIGCKGNIRYNSKIRVFGETGKVHSTQYLNTTVKCGRVHSTQYLSTNLLPNAKS